MSSRTEKPLLSSCMVTRFLKIRQTGLQTDSSRDLQRNIDGSSERARHESIRRERGTESVWSYSSVISSGRTSPLKWSLNSSAKQEARADICSVSKSSCRTEHNIVPTSLNTEALQLAALFSDKPRITHLTQQDSSPPGWDPQSPASPHTESLCHCRGSVAVS